MGFESAALDKKITAVIEKNFPNNTIEQIIKFDEALLKQIIHSINDKRISFPSELLRYLCRYKKLFNKTKKSKRESNFKQKIFDFFRKHNLTPQRLTNIRSGENMFYVTACSLTRMKSNFKNRLRIQYYAQKYFQIQAGAKNSHNLNDNTNSLIEPFELEQTHERHTAMQTDIHSTPIHADKICNKIIHFDGSISPINAKNGIHEILFRTPVKEFDKFTNSSSFDKVEWSFEKKCDKNSSTPSSFGNEMETLSTKNSNGSLTPYAAYDSNEWFSVEKNDSSVASTPPTPEHLAEQIGHDTNKKQISSSFDNHVKSFSEKINNVSFSPSPAPMAYELHEFIVLTPSTPPHRAEQIGHDSNDRLSPDLHQIQSNNSSVINITPQKFHVPAPLLNLLVEDGKDIILPTGSRNVEQLPISTFKKCNYFEGSINLDSSFIQFTKQERTLNKSYSSYLIKNRIGKYINNVCVIVIKYTKYNKKEDSHVLYAACKQKNCKKFKIILKNTCLSVYSTSLHFCHKGPVTSHVKGIERTLLKQQLIKTKPSAYKRESILNVKKNIAKCGNLQKIKSDCVIRKIKSEAVSSLDRDKEDIIDLIKMQRDHGEYIQEVTVPFTVKTFSHEQLSILQRQAVSFLPMVYFDATGTVVRKPFEKFNMKRIYLYSGVIPTSTADRIVPIFEMVSSLHHSKTIFKIFHDFRVFCEENAKWPIFGGVVTDFSFANIHAIVRACNQMDLVTYLNVAFDIATCKNEISDSIITIHLCCAHFMKMISRHVDENFPDKKNASIIKDFIATCITSKSLNDISQWFLNINILLHAQFYDKNVKKAFETLSQMRYTHSSYESETLETTTSIPETDKENNKNDQALYSKSPFYNYFKQLLSTSAVIVSNEGIENPFQSKVFFELLLKSYMPYVPLWTALLIRDCYAKNRFSNAYVENYFLHLKLNILEGDKNLRISRFLRKSREHVLAVHKEVDLNIPKSQLTKLRNKFPECDERQSQETWNKRKKVVTNHFSASYLKTAAKIDGSSFIIEPLKDEEDPFDLENCIYCHFGRLNETTSWVKCDKCLKWVHQKCVSNSQTSFSGEFICKLCLYDPSTENKSLLNESSNIKQKCENFISSLKLDDNQRRELQEKTKDQRECQLWKDERRKRLTASNFGRVFKARSNNTKLRLIKEILHGDDISNVPSIKYGIQNESVAIKLYERRTNLSVSKSGLVVHKDFPFLAASPDGIINTDGIIEIKCPIKANRVGLAKVSLEYLDNNGKLKKTHNHYFQIQGVLEICNRPWCDFVVYAPNEIRVERIYRNQKFWTNILLPKLKEFYLFQYLPYFLFPGAELIENQQKWRTINPVILLENGLVNDISYYKALPCKRDYVVANYDFDVHIKEIRQSDFESISHNNWLTGFVVSILLNIVNSDASVQIIDEIRGTKIFEDDRYSDYFLENVKIHKSKLVIPLIENRNHFCLALLDLDQKTFSFIDPLGSSYDKTKYYLIKLQKFIKRYNQYYKKNIDFNNLEILLRNHILQQDGYNCGPLVIYIFEKLNTSQAATDTCNLKTYRDDLKKKLLEKASNVKNICLFCSRICEGNDWDQCEFCLRKMHKKCTRLDSHSCHTNGMCDICRLY